MRRISPTGFDVLEAPMPALDRRDAAARRAALPVAQGDHGGPVEGGRDEVARRPRVRRRSVGGAAARTKVTGQEKPPARGATQVVRGSPRRARRRSSTCSPPGGSSDGRAGRLGRRGDERRRLAGEELERGRDARADARGGAGRARRRDRRGRGSRERRPRSSRATSAASSRWPSRPPRATPGPRSRRSGQRRFSPPRRPLPS